MLSAVAIYYNVSIGGRGNKADYVKALTKFRSNNATRVMQKAYRSIKSNIKSKIVNREAANKIQTMTRGMNTRTKKILSALRREPIRVAPRMPPTPPSATYVPDLMADTHRVSPMRVKNDVTVAARVRGAVQSFNRDIRRNFGLLQNATHAEYRVRDHENAVSSRGVLTKDQLYKRWLYTIKLLLSQSIERYRVRGEDISQTVRLILADIDESVTIGKRTKPLSHLLFDVVMRGVLNAVIDGNEISDIEPSHGNYKRWNTRHLQDVITKFVVVAHGHKLSPQMEDAIDISFDFTLGNDKAFYYVLHGIQTFLKFTMHDPAKIQKVTYFGKKKKVTKTKAKVTKTKAKVTKTKAKLSR